MGLIEKAKGALAFKRAVDAGGQAMADGFDPKKSLAKGLPAVLWLLGGVLLAWFQSDPHGNINLIVGFFGLPAESATALSAVLAFLYTAKMNRDKQHKAMEAKGAVATLADGKALSEAAALSPKTEAATSALKDVAPDVVPVRAAEPAAR